MIAINDSFMLEAAIYRLIKVHFRDQPFYVDLFELFHETTYQTEMGQLIDLITAPEDHVDLSKFSLDKYVLFFFNRVTRVDGDCVQGIDLSLFSKRRITRFISPSRQR